VESSFYLSLCSGRRPTCATSPGVPRVVVVAFLAALLWTSATTRAEIEGDRFERKDWRVRMSAPRNWQLTERTAYPNILLSLVRRAPDGKMMLAAERLAAGETAQGYARRTADILRSMNFEVRSPQLHSSTGAYFVDSQGRGAFLRQAFLVAGGIGYSLTLSAPDNRTRSQLLRAFDYALRSIQILRPPPPPAPEKVEPVLPSAPSPIDPDADEQDVPR
jgi:hypothetical protein